MAIDPVCVLRRHALDGGRLSRKGTVKFFECLRTVLDENAPKRRIESLLRLVVETAGDDWWGQLWNFWVEILRYRQSQTAGERLMVAACFAVSGFGA